MMSSMGFWQKNRRHSSRIIYWDVTCPRVLELISHFPLIAADLFELAADRWGCPGGRDDEEQEEEE